MIRTNTCCNFRCKATNQSASPAIILSILLGSNSSKHKQCMYVIIASSPPRGNTRFPCSSRCLLVLATPPFHSQTSWLRHNAPIKNLIPFMHHIHSSIVIIFDISKIRATLNTLLRVVGLSSQVARSSLQLQPALPSLYTTTTTTRQVVVWDALASSTRKHRSTAA